MNKFLKVKTVIGGNILINAASLSGVVEITSEIQLYLPFVNSSSSAATKIGIIGGAGTLFQTNAQQTIDTIINTLEKVNQSGYTKAVVELEFPGVILQDFLFAT